MPIAVVALSAEDPPAVHGAAPSLSSIAARVDTSSMFATARIFVAVTTLADAAFFGVPKPSLKDHYCSPSLSNMMGHDLQLSISACLLSGFLLPAYLRSLEYREARANTKSTKTASRINTFIYYMSYDPLPYLYLEPLCSHRSFLVIGLGKSLFPAAIMIVYFL